MNTVAYEENQRNQKAIQVAVGGGVKVLNVDMGKVTYETKPWSALSSFQKKKLENRIKFSDSADRSYKKIVRFI